MTSLSRADRGCCVAGSLEVAANLHIITHELSSLHSRPLPLSGRSDGPGGPSRSEPLAGTVAAWGVAADSSSQVSAEPRSPTELIAAQVRRGGPRIFPAQPRRNIAEALSRWRESSNESSTSGSSSSCRWGPSAGSDVSDGPPSDLSESDIGEFDVCAWREDLLARIGTFRMKAAWDAVAALRASARRPRRDSRGLPPEEVLATFSKIEVSRCEEGLELHDARAALGHQLDRAQLRTCARAKKFANILRRLARRAAELKRGRQLNQAGFSFDGMTLGRQRTFSQLFASDSESSSSEEGVGRSPARRRRVEASALLRHISEQQNNIASLQVSVALAQSELELHYQARACLLKTFEASSEEVPPFSEEIKQVIIERLNVIQQRQSECHQQSRRAAMQWETSLVYGRRRSSREIDVDFTGDRDIKTLEFYVHYLDRTVKDHDAQIRKYQDSLAAKAAGRRSKWQRKQDAHSDPAGASLPRPGSQDRGATVGAAGGCGDDSAAGGGDLIATGRGEGGGDDGGSDSAAGAADEAEPEDASSASEAGDYLLQEILAQVQDLRSTLRRAEGTTQDMEGEKGRLRAALEEAGHLSKRLADRERKLPGLGAETRWMAFSEANNVADRTPACGGAGTEAADEGGGSASMGLLGTSLRGSRRLTIATGSQLSEPAAASAAHVPGASGEYCGLAQEIAGALAGHPTASVEAGQQVIQQQRRELERMEAAQRTLITTQKRLHSQTAALALTGGKEALLQYRPRVQAAAWSQEPAGASGSHHPGGAATTAAARQRMKGVAPGSACSGGNDSRSAAGATGTSATRGGEAVDDASRREQHAAAETSVGDGAETDGSSSPGAGGSSTAASNGVPDAAFERRVSFQVHADSPRGRRATGDRHIFLRRDAISFSRDRQAVAEQDDGPSGAAEKPWDRLRGRNVAERVARLSQLHQGPPDKIAELLKKQSENIHLSTQIKNYEYLVAKMRKNERLTNEDLRLIEAMLNLNDDDSLELKEDLVAAKKRIRDLHKILKEKRQEWRSTDGIMHALRGRGVQTALAHADRMEAKRGMARSTSAAAWLGEGKNVSLGPQSEPMEGLRGIGELRAHGFNSFERRRSQALRRASTMPPPSWPASGSDLVATGCTPGAAAAGSALTMTFQVAEALAERQPRITFQRVCSALRVNGVLRQPTRQPPGGLLAPGVGVAPMSVGHHEQALQLAAPSGPRQGRLQLGVSRAAAAAKGMGSADLQLVGMGGRMAGADTGKLRAGGGSTRLSQGAATRPTERRKAASLRDAFSRAMLDS